VMRRAWDRVFEEMGERAVADVVKEGGREGVARRAGGDLLPERELVMNLSKPREQALHHERRAKRVGETGVLGTGERDGGDAELTHATKTLDLGGREEARDDLLFLRLERDEAVDRVAENHAGTVARARWTVATEPSSP